MLGVGEHLSVICSLCLRVSVSVAHVDSLRSVDKNKYQHTVASGRQMMLYFGSTLFKLRMVKRCMCYFLTPRLSHCF